MNRLQLDLEGNEVIPAVAQSPLPPKSKLAVMAATGTDIRLLIIILIAMELPVQGLLTAAGC